MGSCARCGSRGRVMLPPGRSATRTEATLALDARPAAARVPRSVLSVRDGRAIVERRHLFWCEEIPVEIVRADASYVELRGVTPGTELALQTVAVSPASANSEQERADGDQALR